MLFRPEEVVLPSAAAAIDVGFWRRDLENLAVVKDHVDAVGAVGACVVDDDPLAAISAADQQQEVHGSGHIKLLAASQGDGVEVETQALKQVLVSGS